jgi:hypothetical protein
VPIFDNVLELLLGHIELAHSGIEAGFFKAGLRIAAPNQPNQLLRDAFIVTHDMSARLRHRARHLLLAGFAGRGFIANFDVAIGHDGYPSLGWENDNARRSTKVARCPTEST